jgi:hypothetical protein
MSASNNSIFNLRSILEKEKLNGTNFIDWYRNRRIVLRQEKKEYVLDTSRDVVINDVALTSLKTPEWSQLVFLTFL